MKGRHQVEIKQRIGRNVRRLRADRELTQEALAKKCKMSLRYVSSIETSGENVTVEALEKLAAALGCTVSQLLDGGESGPQTHTAEKKARAARPEAPPKGAAAGLDYAISLLRKARRTAT
jgi:transcriptional regulator with XRE-family HTH domain